MSRISNQIESRLPSLEYALLALALSACSGLVAAADPARLIRDIRPGSASSLARDNFGSLDPTGFMPLGAYVYFAANDGVSGLELWRTDGTSEGTTLVADLRAGADGSNPGNFTVIGGKLFFTAFDDTRPTGGNPTLFVLNGSEGAIVKPNPDLIVLSRLQVVGNDACFSGLLFGGGFDSGEVFCSDGTAAGSRAVVEINQSFATDGKSNPTALTAHQGSLFFFGGSNDQGGFWQNTQYVAELIPPGSCGSQLSGGINSLPSGLYFAACVNDGPPNGGVEPYIFEGGSARKLADLNSGLGSSPGPFFEFGQTRQVYFVADGDDNDQSGELYSYDPASRSVTAMLDQAGGRPQGILGFFDFGRFFLFDTGSETYRSDGTAAGTVSLRESLNVGALLRLPNSDKALSNLRTDNPGSFVLTNGQLDGTSQIQANLAATQFAVLGDKVIFNGIDKPDGVNSVHGAEPRVALISELLVPRARFRLVRLGAEEIGEGSSTTVTVDLSVVPDATVGFDLAFSGTASAADYTASSARLTFAAGERTKTFTLTALRDAENEADETVSIRLIPDVPNAVGNPDVLPFVLKNGESTGTGGGGTPTPTPAPTPTTPQPSAPETNSGASGGAFSPVLCLILLLLRVRLASRNATDRSLQNRTALRLAE